MNDTPSDLPTLPETKGHVVMHPELGPLWDRLGVQLYAMRYAEEVNLAARNDERKWAVRALPTLLWEAFISRLNAVKPLGTPRAPLEHVNFLGSIESYRGIFVEAAVVLDLADCPAPGSDQATCAGAAAIQQASGLRGKPAGNVTTTDAELQPTGQPDPWKADNDQAANDACHVLVGMGYAWTGKEWRCVNAMTADMPSGADPKRWAEFEAWETSEAEKFGRDEIIIDHEAESVPWFFCEDPTPTVQPEDDQLVIVAGTMDGPHDWRTRTGYFCGETKAWHVIGASWKPIKWTHMPDPCPKSVNDGALAVRAVLPPADAPVSDQEEMEQRGWVNVGYKHDLDKARRVLSYSGIPGWNQGMSVDNAIYELRRQRDEASEASAEPLLRKIIEDGFLSDTMRSRGRRFLDLASTALRWADALPSRMEHPRLYSDEPIEDQLRAQRYREGWNGCLDKVLAILAISPPTTRTGSTCSAGPVDGEQRETDRQTVQLSASPHRSYFASAASSPDAATIAPATNATQPRRHDDLRELNALARILMEAWTKAEPDHPITKNPASYWSTFFDMGRAALLGRDANALPQMRAAIRNTESSEAHHVMVFKFQSREALRAADEEWCAQ